MFVAEFFRRLAFQWFLARGGHTARPMLTVPLGVRARLVADGEGKLEILDRRSLHD